MMTPFVKQIYRFIELANVLMLHFYVISRFFIFLGSVNTTATGLVG
jgi:hypothetical protein